MADAIRVEDLAQYGRGLDDMPTRVIVRQSIVFMTELRRRYGIAGVARTMWSMLKERRIKSRRQVLKRPSVIIQ